MTRRSLILILLQAPWAPALSVYIISQEGQVYLNYHNRDPDTIIEVTSVQTIIGNGAKVAKPAEGMEGVGVLLLLLLVEIAEIGGPLYGTFSTFPGSTIRRTSGILPSVG